MYKNIPGYGGRYQINENGQIQRIFKTCVTAMRPSIKQGLAIIRLMGPDGRRKEERVHKLMQKTFLPPPKPGQVLYHKNGAKLDNWINNLGYISRQELGEATGGSSRRKPVVKLNMNREALDFYSSARQAAKANHMSYQTVMDYCNGNVKKQIAPDGYLYVWDEDFNY